MLVNPCIQTLFELLIKAGIVRTNSKIMACLSRLQMSIAFASQRAKVEKQKKKYFSPPTSVDPLIQDQPLRSSLNFTDRRIPTEQLHEQSFCSGLSLLMFFPLFFLIIHATTSNYNVQ